MVVKICANKSVDEAKMCLDAGADIIGVLVGQEHNSTDFITKEKAKEICEFVNGRCDVSLVTHLKTADEIIELTKFIGNNTIQLHSNIDENEVEKIHNALPNIKLVRLVHISSNGQVVTDLSKMKYVDYYLLDSFNLKTNQVGGTGLTHDWNKSKQLIQKLNKPTFLAGGLNPENVKQAIIQSNPYGVDVNSGCKQDGKKNAEKVMRFVKNAKSCLKAIIFDFDGTLYSGDVWKNWKDYLVEFLRENFENAEDLIRKLNIDNSTSDLKIAQITIEKYGNAELFYNYKGSKIFDLDLTDFQVVDVDLLKLLNEKYKLFIVSNSHINYLKYYLKKFNISECLFGNIYDNKFEVSDTSKTSIYSGIIKDYNFKPNEVVVIGDSYNSDILPAINLNMNATQVDSVVKTNEILKNLLDI